MVKLRAWIDRHPPLRRFIYFFPIQLVLVQVKKNPVLIIFWLLMFGFITGNFASQYGVSLLFVDPEYNGHVNFLSYFIIGFSCGGFIMAYQISCYIYNAFRFPFLATCNRPFFRFCINNFIIPMSFFFTYLGLIISFLYREPVGAWTLLADVSSFIVGSFIFVAGSLIYFFRTTKDMESLYGMVISDITSHRMKRVVLNRDPLKKTMKWKAITPGKEGRDWHVESYISSLTRIRRARPFEHYDKELLNRVFMQNHRKAVLFEVIVIATLLLLGFFRNVPAFMIPAGASIFLLFTLYLMFTGVLNTWFRGWTNIVIVLFLVVINFVHKLDPFDAETRAYGMNYHTTPAVYSNDEILRYARDAKLRHDDSLSTIQILENWKSRNADDPSHKPRLVILSCSGGGLRSASWTFYTMQYLDSISRGRLLPRTALICGSSGGMLGAAYMRELWLRDQAGGPWRHNDPKYRGNIASDVLNPIAFSIAVNDWFVPLQRVSYGSDRYSRNRAYAFEEAFLDNTDRLMDKRLIDYREPERKALIPMMIFAPTIVNDGRKLIVSSQGVSYLVQQPNSSNVSYQNLPDAIEFSRFFREQNADSVRFASVLRMNATFPYITPLTNLPSTPSIEVFDAGMRDNFGVENIMRFLYTFRDWIAANTSGVIIIQTRDKTKLHPVEKADHQSITHALSRPLGSFYGNLFTVQDYNHDFVLGQTSHWFAGPVDVIDFELKNEEPDLISLSWHLTNREKLKVTRSMEETHNRASADRFLELLNDELPPSVMHPSASVKGAN